MLTGIVTNFGLPFVQDVGWGVLFASFAAIFVLLVKELIEENRQQLAQKSAQNQQFDLAELMLNYKGGKQNDVP